MQNIVIEKPYEFVPPHRGHGWPNLIQRFRLIDYYLRKSQGIVDWEVRHDERLAASLAAGHGILLAPNHCRPDDAVVMGFLGRKVKTHVFAMASWHLFHQDRFTAWAIRKMGGFSVNREGIDRQAINTAIDILRTAERPLILFPEGAVSRTNDRLHALLDGVAFIARSAAKRRSREVAGGQVVVHPVALKYLFLDELAPALDPVLTEIEHRLTWRPQRQLNLLDRITNVGLALLALKEIEYLGRPQSDRFEVRLQRLIDRLLHPLELEWLGEESSGPVVPRVKALRMKILPDMVRGSIEAVERERRWRHLEDIYLAQQVSSYPADYLSTHHSATRLLETVERFEEDLTDKTRVYGRMKVIIEVGEAITVSPDRDRQATVDPLMERIERDLSALLNRLSHESKMVDFGSGSTVMNQ
ncbi:MAG: 1-acyl-sn-glycerol-3-phosphate acyltransferase [Planctomycetales bacterium]|nr:1-acyl-sn-glycerol-3-phosphate acyltransferase [Planctomycetales bacterium]